MDLTALKRILMLIAENNLQNILSNEDIILALDKELTQQEVESDTFATHKTWKILLRVNDTSKPIGQAKTSLIDCRTCQCDLYDIFDAISSEMLSFYCTLFDVDGYLYPEIEAKMDKKFGDTHIPLTFFYLREIYLLTGYHGYGYGSKAIKILADEFNKKCDMMVLKPNPLQYCIDRSSSIGRDAWEKINLDQFYLEKSADRSLALSKLKSLYMNCGFFQISDDENFLICL